MPINVLHLITTLDTGGAEMMLYRLLPAMDPERFENRVVCMAVPGRVAGWIAQTGIPVTSLGMRRGVPSPRALVELGRLIRKTKPDILQTWMYHADLLGFLASKLTGRGNLIWNLRCSDLDPRDYGILTGLTIKACKWLSPFPSAIVANSMAAERYHRQLGFNSRNFLVIPNGFDLQRFKPDSEVRRHVRYQLGLSDNTLCVGCISRFDPAKDHRTLLEAIAICRQKGIQAVYILCGKGLDRQNRQLHQWIEASRSVDDVKLMGPRDDIPRIMTALDILVSSSVSEGFPNVIGEAMASGVPCVVTDAGDSATIVGDTGMVVPTADPMALAEALVAMLALPEKQRRELGARARRRIETTYGLSQVVSQYEKLYHVAT